MGSRACFSFLASDQGVSAGMYSSLRASCWPELPCLPVICGLSQPQGSGCKIRFCFIPRPCFWALVNVDAALRGTSTPRKAFSSGWELLMTRRAPEGPQSQDACLQVICEAELRALSCNRSSRCPHIKDRFHNQSQAKVARQGLGREESCWRGALRGDGSVRLGGAERPLESRHVTCQ